VVNQEVSRCQVLRVLKHNLLVLKPNLLVLEALGVLEEPEVLVLQAHSLTLSLH
jgi:hypothetical protein